MRSLIEDRKKRETMNKGPFTKLKNMGKLKITLISLLVLGLIPCIFLISPRLPMVPGGRCPELPLDLEKSTKPTKSS